MGDRLLLHYYQYPNLSKGADRVGGQLRGDKEYPFSGVTKPGRVWRKLLEKKKKKKKEFRLDDSNDCVFICAGVNFVGGYK